MVEWVNECIMNGTNRLSISIHMEVFKFITFNHTDIHSYLTNVETGDINR